MLSLSSRPFDPINSVELMNYDERGDVRSESFVSQETRAKLFLLDCVRSERRSHQLEEHEHYAGTRRTARPSENITGQARIRKRRRNRGGGVGGVDDDGIVDYLK
ncbi:hypothetical protein ACO22_01977 [Paracoccidioides brasiliensis]|uniref:Uncharacterized protein n=1 Tax=Paracoccidioides brasiliensis TaxID=121759 RepID=A0A1D2JJX5_PARBR|nr:hypothetical protein ACO22_01977 [Paracoccidioides brasiliensis]